MSELFTRLHYVPWADIGTFIGFHADAEDGFLLAQNPFPDLITSRNARAMAEIRTWFDSDDAGFEITPAAIMGQVEELTTIRAAAHTEAKWRTEFSWKHQALEYRLEKYRRYRILWELHFRGWCPGLLFHVKVRGHWRTLIEHGARSEQQQQMYASDLATTLKKCGLLQPGQYAKVEQAVEHLGLRVSVFLDGGQPPPASKQQRTVYEEIQRYKERRQELRSGAAKHPEIYLSWLPNGVPCTLQPEGIEGGLILKGPAQRMEPPAPAQEPTAPDPDWTEEEQAEVDELIEAEQEQATAPDWIDRETVAQHAAEQGFLPLKDLLPDEDEGAISEATARQMVADGVTEDTGHEPPGEDSELLPNAPCHDEPTDEEYFGADPDIGDGVTEAEHIVGIEVAATYLLHRSEAGAPRIEAINTALLTLPEEWPKKAEAMEAIAETLEMGLDGTLYLQEVIDAVTAEVIDNHLGVHLSLESQEVFQAFCAVLFRYCKKVEGGDLPPVPTRLTDDDVQWVNEVPIAVDSSTLISDDFEVKAAITEVDAIREWVMLPANISRAGGIRVVANKMQKRIDDCSTRHQGRPATRKRLQEQAAGHVEAMFLRQVQTAMHAVADALAGGDCPDALKKIRHRKTFETLTRWHNWYLGLRADGRPTETPRETVGWDFVGRYVLDDDLGLKRYSIFDRPSYETAMEALAYVNAFPDFDNGEEKRRLDELLGSVELSRPPGYFRTPSNVAARMMGLVFPIPNGSRILEPSGGSGSLLDALLARLRGARTGTVEPVPAGEVAFELEEAQVTLHVVEINGRLREILTLKGYGPYLMLSPFNFLEVSDLEDADRYEVILMNPPFEKGADMEHVQHAFRHCLRPGGCLVAIMGEGTFHGTTKKHKAFREAFLEEGDKDVKTCEWRDNEAGAFTESGTGVKSKMVILDKQPNEVNR